MWIDSHCHLNDEAFTEDYLGAISRAVLVGVKAILVVGCDLPSSQKAVELAAENDQLWAAVGVHPHDAKSWNDNAAFQLVEMLNQPKVVAIGEIGLDYHYNYSTKEDQLKVFQEQLRLAGQYNKPVIIHTREAWQDTMAILTEKKIGPAGGVMHCFTGSYEVARECLDLGLHLSLAGPITFSNAARSREVVARLPLDRLLVETDSPYLTPHPFRGNRNEPSRVVLVGEKLAEIKGLQVAEVMEATTHNFCNLFKIDLNILNN